MSSARPLTERHRAQHCQVCRRGPAGAFGVKTRRRPSPEQIERHLRLVSQRDDADRVHSEQSSTVAARRAPLAPVVDCPLEGAIADLVRWMVRRDVEAWRSGRWQDHEAR